MQFKILKTLFTLYTFSNLFAILARRIHRTTCIDVSHARSMIYLYQKFDAKKLIHPYTISSRYSYSTSLQIIPTYSNAVFGCLIHLLR